MVLESFCLTRQDTAFPIEFFVPAELHKQFCFRTYCFDSSSKLYAMSGSQTCNGMISENGQRLNGVANMNSLGDAPRHRPLTPARMLRGLLCLIIYISSAFTMLVYCAPFAASFLRLFSIHYSRKATSVLFGSWLALWPFLFEKINKTKVIFSGDSVPEDARLLIFANHRTEVDWMYLWDLAMRKRHLGYIKYMLKSSLMKMPIFGWGFHVLEFISVQRKWENDDPIIRKMLSTFQDPRDSLWLAVFPEGTDYTAQKCIKSQKFAAENGMPVLKNVLLPKTKGFCACLEALRSSLDAVYDITIAYKHRCPLFMDNAYGVDPSEVHMNVKRISLSEIPTTEVDATAWLIERFKIKDQLLSDFAAQGHFPNEGTESDFSTFMCLLNIVPVLALTCLCTYLTFFSSVWFKMYVTLSCAYLITTTYLDFRPSPIFDGFRTLIRRR